VVFSRDSARAGLSGHGYSGVILEVTRPTVVRQFAAARARDMGSLIGAMDFTRDGQQLALATWRGVDVIDVATGKVQAAFPGIEGKMDESSAVFAPDGSAIYVCSVEQGLRRYRRLDDGTFAAGELLDAEKQWLVTDVASDGSELLLVNRDLGQVKITDGDGKPRRVFARHPHAMFAAWSADRRWLATQASGRGESAKIGARVWSLADETLVKEFATGPLGFVAFSGNGRWLGVAGLQKFEVVRVGDWIAANSALPQAVANAESAVFHFAQSAELLASTVNEKVYLLHPATGAELGLLTSPSGNTSTARVRLNDNGTCLAVMWDDGSFDLWDLATLNQQLVALGISQR
jgi:WD40 repeat protein